MQDVPKDDVQFLLDLGLCVMFPEGGLVIANPRSQMHRTAQGREITVIYA
jgi:hypothetical protein